LHYPRSEGRFCDLNRIFSLLSGRAGRRPVANLGGRREGQLRC
jgi:hypothetical protein